MHMEIYLQNKVKQRINKYIYIYKKKKKNIMRKAATTSTATGFKQEKYSDTTANTKTEKRSIISKLLLLLK